MNVQAEARQQAGIDLRAGDQPDGAQAEDQCEPRRAEAEPLLNTGDEPAR